MKFTTRTKQVLAGGIAALGLGITFLAPGAFDKMFEEVKADQQQQLYYAESSLQYKKIDTTRLDDYVEIGGFGEEFEGHATNGYVIGVVPSATTGGYKVYPKFSAGSKGEENFYDIPGHYAPRGIGNTTFFDLKTDYKPYIASGQNPPIYGLQDFEVDLIRSDIATVKRYGSNQKIEERIDSLNQAHQIGASTVGAVAAIGGALAAFLATSRKKKETEIPPRGPRPGAPGGPGGPRPGGPNLPTGMRRGPRG